MINICFPLKSPEKLVFCEGQNLSCFVDGFNTNADIRGARRRVLKAYPETNSSKKLSPKRARSVASAFPSALAAARLPFFFFDREPLGWRITMPAVSCARPVPKPP